MLFEDGVYLIMIRFRKAWVRVICKDRLSWGPDSAAFGEVDKVFTGWDRMLYGASDGELGTQELLQDRGANPRGM